MWWKQVLCHSEGSLRVGELIKDARKTARNCVHGMDTGVPIRCACLDTLAVSETSVCGFSGLPNPHNL